MTARDPDPRKVLDRLRQQLADLYQAWSARRTEIDRLEAEADDLMRQRDKIEARVKVIEEEFGLTTPAETTKTRLAAVKRLVRAKVAARKGRPLTTADAIDSTLQGASQPLSAEEIWKLVSFVPGVIGADSTTAIRSALSRHASSRGWEKLPGRPARWRASPRKLPDAPPADSH